MDTLDRVGRSADDDVPAGLEAGRPWSTDPDRVLAGLMASLGRIEDRFDEIVARLGDVGRATADLTEAVRSLAEGQDCQTEVQSAVVQVLGQVVEGLRGLAELATGDRRGDDDPDPFGVAWLKD